MNLACGTAEVEPPLAGVSEARARRRNPERSRGIGSEAKGPALSTAEVIDLPIANLRAARASDRRSLRG